MKTGKQKHMHGRSLCLAIVTAAMLLMGAYGCGSGEDSENGMENGKSAECVSVDLAEVKTEDLEEIIRGIGSTEAFQSVVVYPEINGTIESVHFDEGQQVEKGKLLFTLDDARIQAELDARQAALEEAEANRENAHLVFDRRQRLYEQNLGTEEARDEARTRYQSMVAQVKRLQAEIRNIRETMDDTRIRAPFDGTLGEHMVDPGQVVDTNTVLTSIVETQRLKIAFTAPERHMARIKTGQELRIMTPAYAEKTFPGTIYFIDPRISAATRSLKIKARMDNPDNMLRPGGFVSVELIAAIRDNVLIIPEEALIPTRTGYMVFTIKNGKARGREVEIGLRKPGIVEITSGLENGEPIVRAGHISLYEGAQVCGE